MIKNGRDAQVPTGWVRTTLANLGKLHCGQSPSSSDVNREGYGVPYVSGPEHWDGFKLHLDKWTTRPKRQVPPGCIFITVKGAGVGTIFPGVQCAIGRDIYAFEPNQGIPRKFVEFAIRSTVNDVIRKARGDIPGLSKAHILNHEVLLPEDELRVRIADKIDVLFTRAHAGEHALDRAAALVKRYRQSVLKAAVTGELTKEWREKNLARLKREKRAGSDLLADILKERRATWEAAALSKLIAKGKRPKDDRWKQRYVEPAPPKIDDLPDLPKGWVWATLDMVLADLKNGLSKTPVDQPPGERILRISAVRAMSVNANDTRYYRASSAAEIEGYFVRSGDLLFTRYNGSAHLVGVCGLYRSREPVLHPDKLIKARLLPMTGLDPRFFEIAMNAGASRMFLESRIKTSAGQHGLAGGDVKVTPIPLPPMKEQAMIVQAVEEALSRADAMTDWLAAATQRSLVLRQSILGSAFSGKLVPQDQRDESASALLEYTRIARGHQTAFVKSAAHKSPKPAQRRRSRPKTNSNTDDRQAELF